MQGEATLESLKAAEAGNEKDVDFQKLLVGDVALFLINDRQCDAILAVLDFFFSGKAVAVL